MNKKVNKILYGSSSVNNLKDPIISTAFNTLIRVRKDFESVSLDHFILNVLEKVMQNDDVIITILKKYDFTKNLDQKKKVLCEIVQKVAEDCDQKYYDYYDNLEEQINNQEQL